jgi:hypothetical protein
MRTAWSPMNRPAGKRGRPRPLLVLAFNDAVAGDARTALTTAYLDAASRTPFIATSATLAGATLPPTG